MTLNRRLVWYVLRLNQMVVEKIRKLAKLKND